MAVPDPLVFSCLSAFPELVHGVFPRTGGHSQGVYAGLNLGLSTGDDRDIVHQNRVDVLASLGLSRALFLSQVHGSEILVVRSEADVAGGLWTGQGAQPSRAFTADGVVSNVKGLGFVIQVADCQAVVMYDPEKQVIANVHSGWRGSVANILGRCVKVMVRTFGCRPENIRAGVSPSLGPCCAEFINYEKEIPEVLWPYKIDGRFLFDFWRMSGDQLTACGVQKRHIEIMGLCTKCRTDLFYSYRADKVTGRFGSAIALKDK